MDSSVTVTDLEQSVRDSEADYDSQFNDSRLRASDPLSPQPRDSFDSISDEDEDATAADATAVRFSEPTAAGRQSPIEVIPLTDAPDESVVVVTSLTAADLQNAPYDPEATHRQIAIAWLIVLGVTTSVFCFPAGILSLVFAVMAWRWETSERLKEREKYEERMRKVRFYRFVSLVSSMVAVGVGVVVACVFISLGLVWSDNQQRPW